MNLRVILLSFVLALPLAVAAQDADSVRPETRRGLFRKVFAPRERSGDAASAAVAPVVRSAVMRLDNSGFVPPAGMVSAVPDSVAVVELPVTDPAGGWYLAPAAMAYVNPSEAVHAGRYYEYAELAEVRKTLEDKGVKILPLFDLSAPNARFEAATGHRMLSDEGFRFVRAILAEFIRSTGFTEMAFVVPDGRYRERFDTFMAGYPGVDYYFAE